MKYKINEQMLLDNIQKSRTEIQAIEELKESIRAILYMFLVCGIEFDEELYSKMDDSGKKYFIGTLEK